jgi:hypothetical protein
MAQPGERVDQLALAVPVDAGDADDLAAPHLERDAAHGLEAAVVEHGQVLDVQERLARLRRPFLDPQQHLAPDHRAREPGLRPPLARDRLDELATAQDADPVGDLEHLVQLVADEDDRLPLRRQLVDDLEQLLRLLRRQDRGRLVEDQDLRTAVESLQDLDALLLSDSDRLDARVRVHGQPERLGELAHPPRSRVVVEQDTRLRRLLRQDDVLGDGHDRNEHEVLVHHPDPELDRVLRRRDRHRLPVHQDLARVGRVEAVEDAHQRRLAGAVLAEQGMDLPAPQIEIDVVVGEHAGELLRYPAELEDRGRVHRAIKQQSGPGGPLCALVVAAVTRPSSEA